MRSTNCPWPWVPPNHPKPPHFLYFALPFIALQRANLETSNLVHWLTTASPTLRSLSLVMCECSLSGRGQGHVSNFYIVDIENFATSNRRYTGDMGWWRSTVVECRSLTGKLSLSCARPADDGWPLTWANHPLQVSQLGQLSLSSFLGR